VIGREAVSIEEGLTETPAPVCLYELEAYDIKFIPNGCQEEAAEPAVGQIGRLECKMSLQADKSGNIPDSVEVRLEIDGAVVKEETIPAYKTEKGIYVTDNYFFTLPGSHTLSFTLDPNHKFSEEDKTNNVFTRAINVATRDEANDLEAKDIYIVPAGASGRTNVIRADKQFLLFYSIFNKSNHKIDNVKIRVRETTPSGDEIDWVNVNHARIDARRLVTYCFEASWPDVGRHDLWLYVDFHNEIPEMNESNNSKGIKIEVVPRDERQTGQNEAASRQDVIAGDIRFIPKGQETIASEITVGMPGTIRGRLSNISGSVMNSVEFIIQVDGNSVYENTISLKPGQSEDYSVDEFSFDTPGPHSIRLTVDPNNKLTESNELNNTLEFRIYAQE
jgi:subtilase family serine protease